MAKNKKRGFFSWLGLGREEKTPQEEAEPLQEQQRTAESDAATPAEPETPAAKEIVKVTEAVAREQAAQHHVAESDTPLPAKAVDLPQDITGLRAVPEEALLSDHVAEVTPEPEEVRLSADVAEVTPETEEARLSDHVAEVKPEAEEARLSDDIAEVSPETEEARQPEQVKEPFRQEELTPVVDARETEQIEEEESVAAALAKVDQANASVQAEQERPTKEGFFARLKRSLVKTRQNIGSGFIGLFRGKKIDDDLFEELEEQLLIADVGVETTRRIINNLTTQASRKQLRDAEALYGLLKQEMIEILANVDEPLDVTGKTPFVILMVGVNGVGKTTTIGKLARQYQAEGKSVMLAAGDTFRAAAVEQLQVWGDRNNIPVIAQHTGADSASVIFDAIQAAKARHVDVLIADTAGRLQNKSHLMEELKKITRVMKKLDDRAPHEVMLTIDASTGQNAISQTKLFHEAVGLTGITLTKLDGTAKGGVIFSVADRFGIPIRYIGVGEGIEDLRQFKADDFIEALFARED